MRIIAMAVFCNIRSACFYLKCQHWIVVRLCDICCALVLARWRLALAGAGAAGLFVLAGVGAEEAFHAAAGTGVDFVELLGQVVPRVAQGREFEFEGCDFFESLFQDSVVLAKIVKRHILHLEVGILRPDFQNVSRVFLDFFRVHFCRHNHRHFLCSIVIVLNRLCSCSLRNHSEVLRSRPELLSALPEVVRISPELLRNIPDILRSFPEVFRKRPDIVRLQSE